MKILAIETSCDETAIALLDISGPLEKPAINVLGNALMSQAKLHEEYGGVFPTLAKREHQKNLPILLEKIISESRGNSELVGAPEERVKSDAISPAGADIVAVTEGPGLEPALWTGIVFAEELGKKWSVPVIPVNHMEGHVWSILPQGVILPALALLISGGHTELIHIKDFGDYAMLGETKDDAAGEAFDKVARMLGLPYPGGPIISALAKEARSEGLSADFKFPRPMIRSGNLNFSFSGLKTAVLYKLKEFPSLDEKIKKIVSMEFENAVADVLEEKTRQALESLDGIKTLIVAGGVSSNDYLRERFGRATQDFPNLSLLIPEKMLATDNAMMIGLAAYVKIMKNPAVIHTSGEIKAQGNLKIA